MEKIHGETKEMIIGIDCETQGLEGKFILGAIAFEKKKTEIYNDRDKMWNRIMQIIENESKRMKPTNIYAHNAQFDVIKIAGKRIYDKRMRFLSFQPFIAEWDRIKTTKKTIKPGGRFLDLYSLFRMPLSDVGNIVGFQKGKMNPKLKKDTKQEYSIQELADISKYCARDAEIVIAAIKALKGTLKEIGLRPKRLITSGQLAMSLFVSQIKRNGLWDVIGEPGSRHIVKTRHEQEIRVAFKGGRVQAFQTGYFDKSTCIDANSLYPYVMANMKFPNLRTEKTIKNVNMRDLKGIIGIAECEATIPKLDIAMLPIRSHDYLIFPRKEGLKLKGIWTIEELDKARREGYKIKVKRAVIYKQAENVFKDYMNTLYKLRKGSSREMGVVIKMMMNNLFGKFGQRRGGKTAMWVDRNEIREYKKDGWTSAGIVGSKRLILKQVDFKGYFVNPIISALISSGGRIFLYNALKKIGKRRLLYCDTDGMIFTGSRIPGCFKLGDGWGEWKVPNVTARYGNMKMGMGDIPFRGVCVDIKGEKKYMPLEQPKISGIGKIYQDKKGFDRGIIKHKRHIGILNSAKTGRTPGSFEAIETTLLERKKDDLILPDDVLTDDKLI